MDFWVNIAIQIVGVIGVSVILVLAGVVLIVWPVGFVLIRIAERITGKRAPTDTRGWTQ